MKFKFPKLKREKSNVKVKHNIDGTQEIEVRKDLPAIRILNYTKKFGKFIANKDVTFDVDHGVIHGFIGPNGSGKTTTIKTIIGAYTLDQGVIEINGNKPGTSLANTLIGYIPERASFPKHLNTEQYLVAMAELSGIKTKIAKKRAKTILKELGMDEHAKRKPGKFSSGMQKKILLAQSLMHDPSILILDEPAANLDPDARKELFDKLRDLRDQGKTVLISSHILSELERLVDEVTFLYYGEVLYSGTTEKLISKENDIFIKFDDNEKGAALLRNLGYKVKGDMKQELEIWNLNKAKADAMMKEVVSAGLSVTSFRSNDLSSAYSKLVAEADHDGKGHQTLDNEKVIAKTMSKEGESNE